VGERRGINTCSWYPYAARYQRGYVVNYINLVTMIVVYDSIVRLLF
jgi:hypothetical protein